MIKGTGKHHYFSFSNFNKVIRTMVFSEVLVMSAFGLTAPIFAIYITGDIKGADVQTAALATTIYLMTRSLGQVPIGMLIDRMRGERDDLIAMIVGTLLSGFVPLMYMYADLPWHVYAIQFFYGLSAAIIFPAWMAIFTRHIDARHEGMEWGAYRSFVDLGTALAAFAGGFIAVKYGFDAVFMIVSAMTFAAALHLLSLRDILIKKNK